MTPTPSPTPTPRPQLGFSFDDDADGWDFVNQVPQFEPVFARYNSAIEALDIVTNGNENSFGFWENVSVFDTHTTGTETLFCARWTIQSDLEDLSTAPVVRLRTSTEDFAQSNVMVVTSSGNGNYSPPFEGREYVQYFTLPEEDDPFRTSFDILNFDPNDTVFSRMSLSEIVIESTAKPTEGTQEFTFNFEASGDLGFTDQPETPVLQKPDTFTDVTGEGLAISHRGAVGEGAIFGYWGATTSQFIQGNTLYRITWTVGSNASDEDASRLPAIRLRMNDSSFKFSSLINIESVEGSDLPSLGESKVYEQWIRTPAEIAGTNFVFAFDYLYTNAADNPALKIILKDLTVTRY